MSKADENPSLQELMQHASRVDLNVALETAEEKRQEAMSEHGLAKRQAAEVKKEQEKAKKEAEEAERQAEADRLAAHEAEQKRLADEAAELQKNLTPPSAPNPFANV